MRFLRAVGQKGTLTLPSEIREVLDVQDGDIVEFEVVGIVRRRNAPKPSSGSPAPAASPFPNHS